MVLKGFFANINMKLKKNLEVMDVGAELSIKSNPLTIELYGRKNVIDCNMCCQVQGTEPRVQPGQEARARC